jgi:hypothetical protein
MRLLFISFVVIAIFVSCSKDNNFPAQLVSVKYQVTSSPKVYTRQGEVTGKTVVESYISSWAGNYFFFNTDTVISYPSDTILFKTRDTLIIPHLQGLWGKRVVKANGGYLYFYLSDTLVGNKRTDNVLNNIAANIGISKPFYMDACPWYVGTNGPACISEKVYDAYIATGTTNRLEFPMLTYKITRRTNNGFSAGLALQNYNNVFDPSVLSLLQDGDTLAIQTARRIYERKN